MSLILNPLRMPAAAAIWLGLLCLATGGHVEDFNARKGQMIADDALLWAWCEDYDPGKNALVWGHVEHVLKNYYYRSRRQGMVHMVRLRYQYPHCLSAAQIDEIDNGSEQWDGLYDQFIGSVGGNEGAWNGSVSANQQISMLASMFLYCERHPEYDVLYHDTTGSPVWKDPLTYNGRTYTRPGTYNGYQFAKDYLCWMMDQFVEKSVWNATAETGMREYAYETDGYIYHISQIKAFQLLRDLALDEEIAQKADMVFQLLCLNSKMDFGAKHWGGSLGRSYAHNIRDNFTMDYAWQVFGDWAWYKPLLASPGSGYDYSERYDGCSVGMITPKAYDPLFLEIGNVDKEPNDYYHIHLENNAFNNIGSFAGGVRDSANWTYVTKYYTLGGNRSCWLLTWRTPRCDQWGNERYYACRLWCHDDYTGEDDTDVWHLMGRGNIQYRNALFITQPGTRRILAPAYAINGPYASGSWDFYRIHTGSEVNGGVDTELVIAVAQDNTALEVCTVGVDYAGYTEFSTAVLNNCSVTANSFTTSRGDVISKDGEYDYGLINGDPIFGEYGHPIPDFPLITTYDHTGQKIIDWNWETKCLTLSKGGETRVYDYVNWTVTGGTQSPPAAPSNLTATAVSFSQIDLAWTDGSTNEVGFHIERSPNGAGTWEQVGTAGADETHHADVGLSPDTAYDYRISAYNAAGSSGYSNIATETTPTNSTPGFSDDFNDCDADGWLPLNADRWSVTDDEGDCCYRIHTTYYDSLPGNRLGEYSLIDGASYGDFTFSCRVASDEDLAANAYADYAFVFGFQDPDNYYYMIFNSGDGYTELFKVVTGGRIVVASATGVWIDDNDDHIVEITRDGAGIAVKQDGVLTLDASDSTFGSGEIGLGSYNDMASFDDVQVTGGGGMTAPLAPSGLDCAALSSSRIALTWTDNSDNESGFKIERSPNGVDGWTEIAAVVANQVSHTDVGLEPSTTYHYRVRAHNGAGWSSYSDTSSTTTLTVSQSRPRLFILAADVVRLRHWIDRGDDPWGDQAAICISDADAVLSDSPNAWQGQVPTGWSANDGSCSPEYQEFVQRVDSQTRKIAKLNAAWICTGASSYRSAIYNHLMDWVNDCAAPAHEGYWNKSIRIDMLILPLMNTYDLLYAEDVWSPGEKNSVECWLLDMCRFIQWAHESTDRRNNIKHWDNAAMAAYGFLVDDSDWYSYAIDDPENCYNGNPDYRMDWKNMIATAINTFGETADLDRGPNSCYYQSMSLNAMALVALFAENHGYQTDLWSYTAPNGRHLKQAFDFQAPMRKHQDPAVLAPLPHSGQVDYTDQDGENWARFNGLPELSWKAYRDTTSEEILANSPTYSRVCPTGYANSRIVRFPTVFFGEYGATGPAEFFFLDIETMGTGTVDQADQWVACGSDVTVTATTTVPTWHFTGWSGDTNDCVVAGDRITVYMNYSRTIAATFVKDPDPSWYCEQVTLMTNASPFWIEYAYKVVNDSSPHPDYQAMWIRVGAGTNESARVRTDAPHEPKCSYQGSSFYWDTTLQSSQMLFSCNPPSAPPISPGGDSGSDYGVIRIRTTQSQRGLMELRACAENDVPFPALYVVGPKSRSQPVITDLSVSNDTLTLYFEVGDPPDRYAVERCSDLRSNGWRSVASTLVKTPSACWKGPVSNGSHQGFWRLRGE